MTLALWHMLMGTLLEYKWRLIFFIIYLTDFLWKDRVRALKSLSFMNNCLVFVDIVIQLGTWWENVGLSEKFKRMWKKARSTP